MSLHSHAVGLRGLVFQLRQAANESPSAAEFTDRQHQFIAALLQWKVDGVVFRINNAKDPGVAEILGASATEESFSANV